jgi:hypothetical protein
MWRRGFLFDSFNLVCGKRNAKTDILRYEECKSKADSDKNSD